MKACHQSIMMEQWMNIKFKDSVDISSETFKISIQELIKFLEEFRGDLQTKLDSFITMEAQILCKRDNQDINRMEEDIQQNDETVSAAENIVPYLEGKMRRFSISNSGVSLSKSLYAA